MTRCPHNRASVPSSPNAAFTAKAGTGTASRMGFEATVCVWVPPAVQVERTMARDGCTREEAQRRIDAQMPIDEKRELADHVIDNSGSPEETAAQVKALVEGWGLAPQPKSRS